MPISAQASSIVSGTPSERATLFIVPMGTMPIVVEVPMSSAATSPIVPSPAATMMSSSPSSTALRAMLRAAFPDVLTSTTGSMPCARSAPISSARSSPPSSPPRPDDGLKTRRARSSPASSCCWSACLRRGSDRRRSRSAMRDSSVCSFAVRRSRRALVLSTLASNSACLRWLRRSDLSSVRVESSDVSMANLPFVEPPWRPDLREARTRPHPAGAQHGEETEDHETGGRERQQCPAERLARDRLEGLAHAATAPGIVLKGGGHQEQADDGEDHATAGDADAPERHGPAVFAHMHPFPAKIALEASRQSESNLGETREQDPAEADRAEDPSAHRRGQRARHPRSSLVRVRWVSQQQMRRQHHETHVRESADRVAD